LISALQVIITGVERVHWKIIRTELYYPIEVMG